MSLIGLWHYKKCDVKTLMIVITLLGGAMNIKKGRHKKHKWKKSSYPLLGIHQVGGTGVFLRIRKKKQKNCGHKHERFCVRWPDTKNIFWKFPKIWPSPGFKCINKMIHLFKNAFRYALWHMLKFISDLKKINEELVRIDTLNYVIFTPDHLKTQEMCNEAVSIEPLSLVYVPDYFKTQKMCNEAVKVDPCFSTNVPDYLITQ